jgi:hypothetical protein
MSTRHRMVPVTAATPALPMSTMVMSMSLRTTEICEGACHLVRQCVGFTALGRRKLVDAIYRPIRIRRHWESRGRYHTSIPSNPG